MISTLTRRMKALLAASAFVLLPCAARAMVYSDSRVLSLAEMDAYGVEISATRGAEAGQGMLVTVSVLPGFGSRTYQSMSYSVLEREPDEDFASTDARKSGIRDTKRWAKEVRGGSTAKVIWAFVLSDQEVPRSYLVVRFNLPPRNGIPVFGSFYFLPRDLRKEASQPSPPPRTSGFRG